jgi:predicted transposase/invertase (TIGR01784 family)
MQLGKSDDDLKARSVVYGASLLSGKARKGEPYAQVKRVYQIFFLNCVIFPQSGKIPRRYFFMEETEHDKLNELIEIIYYELSKLDGLVREYLAGNGGRERFGRLSAEKKWCIYLKYRKEEAAEGLITALCREEEGIMKAERELRKASRDEEKWARALFREKNATLYKSGLYNARQEGIAIGQQEGIAIGQQEGIAIGERKVQELIRLQESGKTLEEAKRILGIE